MWKNQSEIEQAFIYQVVDVQNTKAKQSKQHQKEKLYSAPYPHCVIARYTPHKKMHINQKSLSYVAKVNRCVANRQFGSAII